MTNKHTELPAQANISTAPAMLNMNDKAMWVIGWNECLAAIAAHEQARVVGEPVAWAAARGVQLREDTAREAARFFGDPSKVPTHYAGITQKFLEGGTITRSGRYIPPPSTDTVAIPRQLLRHLADTLDRTVKEHTPMPSFEEEIRRVERALHTCANANS